MTETEPKESCQSCCHADGDDPQLFAICTCSLSSFFEERVHDDNWCRYWSAVKREGVMT